MDFWSKLQQQGPIVGMSPMDGVTDAPMRYMTAKYGRPGLMVTEFVSVDALRHAKNPESVARLMAAFIQAKDLERILDKKAAKSLELRDNPGDWPYEVAQVFGCEPALFYQAAVIVATLGFDGMDINMGCPAKNVQERGSGAGLIRTPNTAQEIVRQAKQGILDWAEGKVNVDDLEISTEVKKWVGKYAKNLTPKQRIPVSVKTRLGVDQNVVEDWMEVLMEVEPAMISLHGRTLKQMYQGQADWEAVGKAAEVVHRSGGYILGNGDVGTLEEGRNKVSQYGVDGFLIGRAAEGNPGVFAGKKNPSWEERKGWMIEHAIVYEQLFGQDQFVPMRKHLAWYCKGFAGASELRAELVRKTSAAEVAALLRIPV